MRVKIVRTSVVIFLALIVLNLFYLQVIRAPYFYELSTNNRIRVIPLEGSRGRILDRNGIVLADNRVSLNVLVMPQEIENHEALFSFLSEALKKDKKSLFKLFLQMKSTPFAPILLVEDISKNEAIVLEENKFRYPGLYIEQSFRRFYPFGFIDAHVLGYVGKISRARIENWKEYGYTWLSHVGYTGVEEYYDNELKGGQGGFQIEVNSRGQQVRLLSLKDPSKGKDIVLTLDQRIQAITHDLLKGKKGAVVIMDLENGEILGLNSSPSYDPNIFVSEPSSRTVQELFSDPSAPLLNRAISGQYPPGSVFKVLVALAALESKKINRGTPFLCPGFYRLGNRQFRCTHIHGNQNLVEAIVHSCNVYFYYVGKMIGAEVISHYARLFELGDPTLIDLPYEEQGLVPSPQHRRSTGHRGWYTGDTLNFAIGQGDLLTTPLQLVGLMSSIANKGRMVQPHLIKLMGSTETNQFSSRKYINVNEKNFSIVLEGLKDVVDEETGTGHVLDIEGLEVFGKTGTAQTPGNSAPHAWFVGFSTFPKKNIVFCVLLEHGGTSRNACEVARELLERIQQAEILSMN